MAQAISAADTSDAPLSAAKHPKLSYELIGRTVTINRPRAQVYAAWRDFRHLSSFMENIRDVEVIDDRRSHWVVEAPGGRTVEWDALITTDQPNELIEWRSQEGASVHHSGRVEFRDAPAERGTEVSVTIAYDPPGGSVGKLIAKLFKKEPNIQARQDLRRFKQLMETGEIATAEPPAAAPRA